MKNLLLALLVLSTLSGCGYLDRKTAAITGGLSEVCHDGVQYLQGTSGLSVAYTKDGKIKTCK